MALDIIARLLGDKFIGAWGKPVGVENVTDAGGNIAAERVAKAAADGYTLLMGGNGSIIVSPSLYEKLPTTPSGTLLRSPACFTLSERGSHQLWRFLRLLPGQPQTGVPPPGVCFNGFRRLTLLQSVTTTYKASLLMTPSCVNLNATGRDEIAGCKWVDRPDD